MNIGILIVLLLIPIALAFNVNEYNGLVKFYNDTNGDNWYVTWPIENQNYCDWYGISCNNDLVSVISLIDNNLGNNYDFCLNLSPNYIYLSNNNLQGNVILESTFLQISNNNISNISTGARFCDLSNNNLYEIPPSCDTYLDISYNKINNYSNIANTNHTSNSIGGNILSANIILKGHDNFFDFSNSNISDMIIYNNETNNNITIINSVVENGCIMGDYKKVIDLDLTNSSFKNINFINGSYNLYASYLKTNSLDLIYGTDIRFLNLDNAYINYLKLITGKTNSLRNITSNETIISLSNMVDFIDISGEINNLTIISNKDYYCYFSNSGVYVPYNTIKYCSFTYEVNYYKPVTRICGGPYLTRDNASCNMLIVLNISNLRNNISTSIDANINATIIRNSTINSLQLHCQNISLDNVASNNINFNISHNTLYWYYNNPELILNNSNIRDITATSTTDSDIYNDIVIYNTNIDKICVNGLFNISINCTKINNMQILSKYEKVYPIYEYNDMNKYRYHYVNIENSNVNNITFTSQARYSSRGGSDRPFFFDNNNIILKNITTQNILIQSKSYYENITVLNSIIQTLNITENSKLIVEYDKDHNYGDSFIIVANSAIDTLIIIAYNIVIINSTINNMIVHPSYKESYLTIINSTVINTTDNGSFKNVTLINLKLGLNNFINIAKYSNNVFENNVDINSDVNFIDSLNSMMLTMYNCGLFGLLKSNYTVPFLDLQYNNILWETNLKETDERLLPAYCEGGIRKQFNMDLHYKKNTIILAGDIYYYICSHCVVSYGHCGGWEGGWETPPIYKFILITLPKIMQLTLSSSTPSITPSVTSSISTSATITPSVTPSITSSISSTITPSISSTITPNITSTITPSISLTITPNVASITQITIPTTSIDSQTSKTYFNIQKDIIIVTLLSILVISTILLVIVTYYIIRLKKNKVHQQKIEYELNMIA